MEQPVHQFSDLFEQLGLASDKASIEAFISEHGPLPATTAIAEAPCWNEGQAAFLREAIADDADWAEVVGHLDAALHQPR
ncbi:MULTISPECIES: DUF2789 domain-containing protein [Halomonadaceae]|uniref:DUF2789 domain-containing protein n=1 Tax=Vreelandella malpeensis TaxID=1172368 RepID=A0ABS8DVW4_9GAMM|nr:MULTISPECIES: DUF2789 domain-containing protein [Halomonas]MCB8890389.1 DUF2789 domain-containing protein [Halomonas malpeensis]MCP1314832.1 DUF2789 domain-containing protein [Halomonas sp. 707D7]MCP1327463.1 DUF2789 domain-containing protein [Halomonas sp. 707D4]